MSAIEQKTPRIPPPEATPEAELTFKVGKLTVVVPRKPHYTTWDIAEVVGQTVKCVGPAISTIKKNDSTIQPGFIPKPNGGNQHQAFKEEDFKKIVSMLLERKNNGGRRGRKKQESFTVSDIINTVSLTEIQEKVLQIIVDKQNNYERIFIEGIKKALITDDVNPSQIEDNKLLTTIRAIQNKLEKTDYELVRHYLKKPKKTYYVLRRKPPLEEYNPKSESAKIETPPNPEAEKAKKLMAAKATLEILSKIAEGKYNDISPNVRIILGHHLPEKATIPDIFGQATDLKRQDDDLKEFLIGSFTNIVDLLWDKDPKTVNDLGKQIIEDLTCLQGQNYTSSQLIEKCKGIF